MVKKANSIRVNFTSCGFFHSIYTIICIWNNLSVRVTWTFKNHILRSSGYHSLHWLKGGKEQDFLGYLKMRCLEISTTTTTTKTGEDVSDRGCPKALVYPFLCIPSLFNYTILYISGWLKFLVFKIDKTTWRIWSFEKELFSSFYKHFLDLFFNRWVILLFKNMSESFFNDLLDEKLLKILILCIVFLTILGYNLS